MDILRLQLEILERTARRESLREVLNELCRLVEQAIPGAICSVSRYDAGTNTLHVRASPCLPPEFVEQFDGLVPGELAGSCGAAAFERRMVIVSNTLEDPRWGPLKGFAEQWNVLSCWSIPFFRGTDEVLGTFSISQPKVAAPTEDQLQLLTTAGHLAGIAVSQDTTAGELRDQRRLLEGLLSSTEDPVFAKDTEGRYLALNPATADSAGSTVAEMLGRTDDQFFTPDVAARFWEVDSLVMSTGEGHLVEGDVDHPTIGRRRYLTRKNPLRSPEGEIVGVVGIARDVTELRQAEEAVQQAQKLESLGVLAGGIAHDFNNLLTGILGNAELAQTRLDLGSSVGVNIERIRKAAERAAELINQMLAYSGRGESVKVEFDLSRIVADVRELLATSISKKANLVFEFEEGLPKVLCDVTQIRQLLMNLILNASEALGDGPGRIVVSIHRKDRDLIVPSGGGCGLRAPSYLVVKVTDDGAGMDDETAARIFDPFFTTKFTGRGLGLAAVQGIVMAHEGRIEVQSRPGAGTTFTVLLPALSGATGASEDELAAEPPAKLGSSVLVIDDEETVRDVAGDALIEAGLDVSLAVDGDAAVAMLEGTDAKVDLILLDLTTPGLSGRAAFLRFRELRPDVPVVLSSGFEEREATQGFEPGELAGYVKKPFRPSQLVDMLVGLMQPTEAEGSVQPPVAAPGPTST